MTRLPRLAVLPPIPQREPVTLTVLCSTTPDMAGAVRHGVQIAADWSVTTPHDLAAERVAAAFGGYLSCLHLVDRVVPTVRDTVQRHARTMLPRLQRGSRGSWRPVPSVAAACCRPEPTAGAAAAHLRSVEHAGNAGGGQRLLVESLLTRLLSAHREAGSFSLDDQQAADLARLVQGPGGAVAVWEAGLHPSLVTAIHDRLVGGDGPALPVALYLGVVARRPDLDWIADTLAAAAAAFDEPSDSGTVGLTEWLAWTQTPLDKRRHEVRAGWLALGLPRPWIEQLSAAGYTPDDARRLSRLTGRSAVGVSDVLVSWVQAGCRPRIDDLVALHADGVSPWYEPSSRALDRLRSHLGDLAAGRTRTDLALVLARAGTVSDAAAALRRHERELMSGQECA